MDISYSIPSFVFYILRHFIYMVGEYFFSCANFSDSSEGVLILEKITHAWQRDFFCLRELQG